MKTIYIVCAVLFFLALLLFCCARASMSTIRRRAAALKENGGFSKYDIMRGTDEEGRPIIGYFRPDTGKIVDSVPVTCSDDVVAFYNRHEKLAQERPDMYY